MSRRGGSVTERYLDRQRKADEMKRWGFSIVMEVLPLMLQVALLLLGCALSRYLWSIDRIVAIVNIAVTSLGVIIYVILNVLATLSYQCPYQTPFSLAFRYLVELDAKHTEYITRVLSLLRQVVASFTSSFTKAKATLHGWSSLHSSHPQDEESVYGVPTEVKVAILPLFERSAKDREELEANSALAASICWILETSTDAQVTSAAIRSILTVDWHDGITTIPSLTALGDTVLHYLSSLPKPKETIAIEFAPLRALLHITIQRPSQKIEIKFPVVSYRDFGSEAVFMMNLVWRQKGYRSFIWRRMNPEINDVLISSPHLSWLCHDLVYFVSHSTEGVPNDIFEFLDSCFSREEGLPASIIPDLVMILALSAGAPLHRRDLSVIDKRCGSLLIV